MIDKLPNTGIEMDVKKLPLFKTTHAQSWAANKVTSDEKLSNCISAKKLRLI
jgi:hypothetical protein